MRHVHEGVHAYVRNRKSTLSLQLAYANVLAKTGDNVKPTTGLSTVLGKCGGVALNGRRLAAATLELTTTSVGDTFADYTELKTKLVTALPLRPKNAAFKMRS